MLRCSVDHCGCPFISEWASRCHIMGFCLSFVPGLSGVFWRLANTSRGTRTQLWWDRLSFFKQLRIRAWHLKYFWDPRRQLPYLYAVWPLLRDFRAVRLRTHTSIVVGSIVRCQSHWSPAYITPALSQTLTCSHHPAPACSLPRARLRF